MTGYTAQIVIHTYLIIEVVKTCTQVVTIETWVIHLGNEEDIRIFLFDLLNRPRPELLWHHLCHIATETVYPFACPKEQDMQHLVPCIRDRIKLLLATTLVEDTVVELDGLKPVVHTRICSKAVVTCSTSRILLVVINIDIRSELMTWNIVEVIERRESPLWIIVST